MNLFYVSSKVVYTNIFFTVWTVSFLSKVDTLNVVKQYLLGLEPFLTERTFIVFGLIMFKLNMMVQVLVLLETDVATGLSGFNRLSGLNGLDGLGGLYGPSGLYGGFS